MAVRARVENGKPCMAEVERSLELAAAAFPTVTGQ